MTFLDPRTPAEAKLYDQNAHMMHVGAVNEANSLHVPYSWMFWQWNKSFTSWERVRNRPYPFPVE